MARATKLHGLSCRCDGGKAGAALQGAGRRAAGQSIEAGFWLGKHLWCIVRCTKGRAVSGFSDDGVFVVTWLLQVRRALANPEELRPQTKRPYVVAASNNMNDHDHDQGGVVYYFSPP